MKTKLPHIVRKGRIKEGLMASTSDNGNNGAFAIKIGDITYLVIASDQAGYDHVSVTIPGFNRTPKWEEMCAIKDLFFNPNEVVIQFHPPEDNYVNFHKYYLHMWRPHGHQVKLPPTWMVGPYKRGGK